MDGGTHRRALVAGMLVLVGCAPVAQTAPGSTLDPTLTVTTETTQIENSVTTIASVTTATMTTTAVTTTPPTTSSTTTTTVASEVEAPATVVVGKPLFDELVTTDLDDLLSDLAQILADLDSSLAQEEGEIFNE